MRQCDARDGVIETEKFDLIFSDVVMPGKSGLEFLEEIRSAGVRTPRFSSPPGEH